MLASLLIGTVSACACSHHEPEPEKVEAETSSCHSHAKEEAQETESRADCFVGDGCICAANAQSTAAKAETLKLKKFAAAITPDALQTIATREQRHATLVTFSAKPFYLSDSFYASAPKRGPPRA